MQLFLQSATNVQSAATAGALSGLTGVAAPTQSVQTVVTFKQRLVFTHVASHISMQVKHLITCCIFPAREDGDAVHMLPARL